jgi:galactokinase
VDGPARTVAELCRQAEHRAGVPVGIMDPLVCAGGVAGHALRIDCATLDCRPVVLPAGLDVLVVDSGLPRTLAGSAYALRVAECEAAAEIVGPLGRAGPDDLPALRDPLLRRRARHVIGECARVDGMVDALVRDDLATVGTLLDDSHRSLSDWFEVSTPAVDDLVARLRAHPGILGVRMTGAGFGGCLVAGAEAGAVDPDSLPGRAWRVRAVDGTVTAADRLR